MSSRCVRRKTNGDREPMSVYFHQEIHKKGCYWFYLASLIDTVSIGLCRSLAPKCKFNFIAAAHDKTEWLIRRGKNIVCIVQQDL